MSVPWLVCGMHNADEKPWESRGTLIRNALRAAIEHLGDDCGIWEMPEVNRKLQLELQQALEAAKDI